MNPTGQPFNPQFGAPPPGGGGGARDAVNVPSILLIVFGALNVLFGLYGLVAGGANADQVAQIMNDPNVPPELKKVFEMLLGPGTKVLGLIGLAISGTMLAGGLQMRNLKAYPLAIAACVMAIIPCTNCCCVTMPIGIWALTILTKPEVKASFS